VFSLLILPPKNGHLRFFSFDSAFNYSLIRSNVAGVDILSLKGDVVVERASTLPIALDDSQKLEIPTLKETKFSIFFIF